MGILDLLDETCRFPKVRCPCWACCGGWHWRRQRACLSGRPRQFWACSSLFGWRSEKSCATLQARWSGLVQPEHFCPGFIFIPAALPYPRRGLLCAGQPRGPGAEAVLGAQRARLGALLQAQALAHRLHHRALRGWAGLGGGGGVACRVHGTGLHAGWCSQMPDAASLPGALRAVTCVCTYILSPCHQSLFHAPSNAPLCSSACPCQGA